MSREALQQFVVPSRLGDYSVSYEQDPSFLLEFVDARNSYFVIDETVWSLYRASILSCIPMDRALVLPIQEDLKNYESVKSIYDQLLTCAAKKNLHLVAIGGGILQDISGFAASTLYRGISWSFVPTTLLAQADSCIGGKTSLNYGEYKNLLGTFFPPRSIHIYSDFLKTQRLDDFLSGLGEVIKLHLLGAASVGDGLLGSIKELVTQMRSMSTEALALGVHRSLDVKRGFIIEDEFDTGRRNLLNYGHCFGHALESASKFRIPHGQAIVVGMMAANIVARNREWLDPAVEHAVNLDLLRPVVNLVPTAEELNKQPIVEAMKRDKKRTGQDLPLVLFRDGFHFERVGDLKEAEVSKALTELAELFKSK